MRTISAMDLRRKTGEWLDRASAGERIVIERDHHPLAVLVPYEDGSRLEESADERMRRTRAALDHLATLGDQIVRERPDLGEADSATTLREEREARADRLPGREGRTGR